MNFPEDKLFKIFSKLISRVVDPIYFKKLKKQRYLIKNAILINVNNDSPRFIKERTIPKCKYKSPMYQAFHESILKYMNIQKFNDSFNNYNKSIIYPESFNESNNYTKFVTIQNRLPYPKTRKQQQRILENGKELLEALSRKLDPNILVRLVDTAQLPIETQISLIQKTDYFIWLHGAGGSLSMFLKEGAINHEVYHKYYNMRVNLVAALNGRKTYQSKIKYRIKRRKNEIIYLDNKSFCNSILQNMNESRFFLNDNAYNNF